MVGPDCLIGLTLLRAKQVLERVPHIVEIVAQRKEAKGPNSLVPAVRDESEGVWEGRGRTRHSGKEEINTKERSREEGGVKGENKTKMEEERKEEETRKITEQQRRKEREEERRRKEEEEGRKAEEKKRTVSPQSSTEAHPSRSQMGRSTSISTSLAYATGSKSLSASWNVSASMERKPQCPISVL